MWFLPELISFVRHLGQLHDVDDRISETYVEIDQLAYYDNIRSGDEVVFIGRQGDEEISADELGREVS